MPVLSNAKHEKFAQGIARGLSQVEAYREAGYSASPNAAMVSASTLVRAPKVAARIAELNAPAIAALEASAQEAIGTASWIVKEAAATYLAAKEDQAYGPAVSALALLAKRHPEFRERDSERPNQTLVLNGLSDAQLEAAIQGLSGRA